MAACNKKTTEIEHAVQDEMQRIQVLLLVLPVGNGSGLFQVP